MLRWESSGDMEWAGYSGNMHMASVFQTRLGGWRWIILSGHIAMDNASSAENAKAAAETAFKAWCERASLPTPEQVAAMIETAVLAEREACALVAEGFENTRDWVPGSLYEKLRREVAAKIRGRSDIAGIVMSGTATNVQKMHTDIPEGFQLVPVEPDFEMTAAAREIDWPLPNIYGELSLTDLDTAAREIYRAMCAAAPKPPID